MRTAFKAPGRGLVREDMLSMHQALCSTPKTEKQIQLYVYIIAETKNKQYIVLQFCKEK